MIVERLFSYEGLGNLAIDAVISRDLPLIQGIVLLFAVLFVGVNLTVDLCVRRPESAAASWLRRARFNRRRNVRLWLGGVWLGLLLVFAATSPACCRRMTGSPRI